MSAPTENPSERERDEAAAWPPVRVSLIDQFSWSLRREVWEHRSLVWAPLAVAVVVVLASLLHTLGQPQRLLLLAGLADAERHARILGPIGIAPAPIMLATFLVGFFYSLDAFYGERRDRSLLFWRSLPVPDLVGVLAKVAVPLVVLPLYAFALSLATIFVLLVAAIVVLAASGVGPGILLGEVRLLTQPVVMIYGLAVHALWWAPLHGWLWLVSAWARRAPIVWAVLPVAATGIVGRIAFDSTAVCTFLGRRFTGAMEAAFAAGEQPKGALVLDQLSQLTPLHFLTRPGLWLSLLFAAGCVAVATRLRRLRAPL